MADKNNLDYAKLGKSVEAVLITDYIDLLHSTKRQIWSSFVRGLFAGLGTVIGATVGVAILVAVLQLFGGAPLIGHWAQDISHTIQNRGAQTK